MCDQILYIVQCLMSLLCTIWWANKIIQKKLIKDSKHTNLVSDIVIYTKEYDCLPTSIDTILVGIYSPKT